MRHIIVFLIKLLPVFTTFVPVMSKIANGADLMLPGIIVDSSKADKVITIDN